MSQIITEDFIEDGAGNDFRMFLLDDAAFQAEKAGQDIIRLTLGKTDVPLHPEITKVMQEALGDMSKCNLVFPTGLPELREALSHHYKSSVGVTIPWQNIIIDSGSSSIFRNIFDIILNGHQEVLLPLPYYPLYKITAKLANGSIAYYTIDERSLRIDLDSLKSNIQKSTRAIVINSPGNPMGNVIDEATLCEIGRLMPSGTYIIFDEIYDNVPFCKATPIVKLLFEKEAFDYLNVIVTNAFSKGYRMYSRRLGWLIAPDHIIKALTSILHHTRLTVDPVVQFGGVEALKHQDEVKALNQDHLHRWNYTVEAFKNLDNVRLIESKGGFYCSIDCREFIKNNDLNNCLNLAMDVLGKAMVATVPGKDFGIPGTLRLSFTNKRYTEAIDRLTHYFNNH
jgi:aspartate/methionine/tyrosine aminotransferase